MARGAALPHACIVTRGERQEAASALGWSVAQRRRLPTRPAPHAVRAPVTSPVIPGPVEGAQPLCHPEAPSDIPSQHCPSLRDLPDSPATDVRTGVPDVTTPRPLSYIAPVTASPSLPCRGPGIPQQRPEARQPSRRPRAQSTAAAERRRLRTARHSPRAATPPASTPTASPGVAGNYLLNAMNERTNCAILTTSPLAKFDSREGRDDGTPPPPQIHKPPIRRR